MADEITMALTHARNTFNRYARLHRAKATDEGDEKACANAGMAEEMQRALDARDSLREAALALYFAGRWSCDRAADEAKLWEDLRDALGIEPGSATAAGVHALAPIETEGGDAKQGSVAKP